MEHSSSAFGVTVTDVTAVELAAIRTHVQTAAHSIGVDTTRTDRFALATSEIVSNAIVHGLPPRTVAVRAGVDDVTVEVADGGAGFRMPSSMTRPATGGSHGRGLWLARQWVDRLDVGTGRSPFVVRLTLLGQAG